MNQLEGVNGYSRLTENTERLQDVDVLPLLGVDPAKGLALGLT